MEITGTAQLGLALPKDLVEPEQTHANAQAHSWVPTKYLVHELPVT